MQFILRFFLCIFLFFSATKLLADQDVCPSFSLNGTVDVQFIYWKYTTPLLVFGRDGIGLSNSATPQEIPVKKSGKSFSPKFQWDPGFKIGAGYKFGCEKAFNLYFNYTWIHSHAHKRVTQREFSASFLPINWLVSNTLASAIYHRASSSFSLLFQCPELQLGYTFTPNKCLKLRPYVAITSLILDGHLHVRYDFTTPQNVSKIAKTHAESRCWSIGPKVGVDFLFMATQNLGIFFNGSITQQASQLHMHTKQVDKFTKTGEKIILQKGKLWEDRSYSIVGLEGGLSWDQWFDEKRYHLQYRVTWQTVAITSGPNLSFLNNNNVDIPLSIEFRGVNFKLLFDF